MSEKTKKVLKTVFIYALIIVTIAGVILPFLFSL